jgi:hypothetical protein
MYSQLGPNLIRTYVPVGVGMVISWLFAHGVQVDSATKASLIVLLTGVLTAGYYTVVRVLEEKWPSVGLLLGARQPAVVHAAAHEYDEHLPASEDQPGRPIPPGPMYGSSPGLAAEVATAPPVQPGKRRGPQTGAIPTYQPPPGR